MQLKTLTLVAASLALAQARVNGTWGDETKAPVLDTTTTSYKPTGKPTDKPVDGGKTDVADETASSTTWDDADLPSSTKPVADSTTQAYWGDETDVADSTVASSTTWADLTDVKDTTTTTTPAPTYWGDETSVADLSSTTTTHWSDYDLTTSEETTVEQITKTITKGDGSKLTTTLVNTKTITHTVYVTPTPVSGGQGKPPGGGAGGPPKETPVLGGEGDGCGVVTVTNTVVKTITVPAGKPTPAPPAATTPAVETEVHTWADVPSVPSDAPKAPVSGGYMGIVETWRSKMGLKQLELDSKLQSNAQDAANSSGGQLKHKLNPGSMAQVMAPGDSGNFESVFVGGWLCELPNTPGLGASVCNEMSKGWNYAGQTGHAEILTSGKYSKIGCALGDGIWCCDLA